MARFLIRRIAQGLFVMWLMTVTVFLIFFVGPGPAFVARVLAGAVIVANLIVDIFYAVLDPRVRLH